jgi:serine/threonine protein kinase
MRQTVEQPRIPDHELVRLIGKGSYGEVWLARNIMGTFRAVKIVYAGSFEDKRPFEREYKGIERFEPISRSHESQVDILHVGRQEGCFYYVMELADDRLNGQEIDPISYEPKSLQSILRQRGHLPAEETLEIALALTTALAHLHSHGLVHRDIKPSNIIFVHGLPKLADIGLVSSVDATRSFVGTEGFLPPEGPGTAQADIYSLGKVLYEACTGRDRKDFPELPTALHELPDRERLLELNAIISKACRAEVRDRYQSAEQMREDLVLAQGGKSIIGLRKVEQRLKMATRIGAVSVALAVLLGGGYIYQSRQSKVIAELAVRSQRAESASRDALVRLQVSNGTKLMREGKLGQALLWFAKALPNVRDNPAQEEVQRMRIASVLANHPKLVEL